MSQQWTGLKSTFTSRETVFNVTKSHSSKIANNFLPLGLAVLNKKIKLDDLILGLDEFKVKYMQILMPS